jgi:hypothetical protein
MRDALKQIELLSNLVASIVVEDYERLNGIINAVEQPVNPMWCVNTSRTDNGYSGRGRIQNQPKAATMLTLSPSS